MNVSIDTRLWQSFISDESLSDAQAAQFKKYLTLLIEWNERFNLTAITDPNEIILYHFRDSLSLRPFIEQYPRPTIADVGTGAGFPGIPLKIVMPHAHVILVEVNQKKITFLNEVITALELNDIEVYPHDWRTFLRNTSYPVDLVAARASLQPKELARMFSPSSPYNTAALVYFASQQWESDVDLPAQITNEKSYEVGDKKRRLIFFSRKPLS